MVLKRKDAAEGAGDFRHFSGHLKRYAQARKEARLLRSGGLQPRQDGAGGEAGDHPWLQASRRAKAASGAMRVVNHDEAAPRDARRGNGTGRPAWTAGMGLAGGALVVLALAFALLRATLPPLPAGPAPAPSRFEVWHALQGEELGELNEVAALLSRDDVHFEPVFRPDLPDALRLGLLAGEVPALAIVELETAESLARAGVLVPLSGAGELYVPLADPEPWTRPLVAVAPRSRGQGPTGEPTGELIREFVRTLVAMRAPGA